MVTAPGHIAAIEPQRQVASGNVERALLLAKAFADRGIVDGVQVNSVSPGAVMTGRRLGMIERLAAARGVTVEEAKQKMLAQAGVARYGEPEEIAGLMAFLVSPGARWMTGASLRIDGGEVKAV